MLSNREIKWIQSLKNKKYRLKHRAYVAEGPRLVNDLIINGQKALKIAALPGVEVVGNHDESVLAEVDESMLKKISGQVQPGGVLGVFEMPADKTDGLVKHPAGQWGIALEFIQDPGNLGTVIRTLAWLGVEHLYCSSDSVDVYNPKVVQASMGAIARLGVHYVDLVHFLEEQDVPLYAADMQGEPIDKGSREPGIIVFGNEGNGLSEDVRRICGKTMTIPKLGSGESLNVAASVAIAAAWFQLHRA